MRKHKSSYQYDFESFFHRDLGYKILADEHQYKYVEALLAPPEEIQAVFVDAKSGTGKSSVALSAAYYLLLKGKVNKIIYVRNTVSLRENGFLPGTHEEKEDVYMKPVKEIINRIGALTNKQDLYDELVERGQLIATSTSYLRGTDIDSDAFILVDEAQNLSLNELRTVLTRKHDSVKLAVIGSHLQVDTPNIQRFGEKGILPFELYIEHFKKQNEVPVREITLVNNYRGRFANLADEIHNTVSVMDEEVKQKPEEELVEEKSFVSLQEKTVIEKKDEKEFGAHIPPSEDWKELVQKAYSN